MKRLAEFSVVEDGRAVVVVDDPPEGTVTRGLGNGRYALVRMADKTFGDATTAITPAVRSLIARLRSFEDPPDEVGIGFGVQLSAQSGAFIAVSRGRSQLCSVVDIAAPRRHQ